MSQANLSVRFISGLSDYQQIFQEMRSLTAARNENSNDELWFLEHQHVFTQGKAGKPEHVLNPGDVPIIQTDRGGQITYHGPGQLIIYPLIDLHRKKMGAKKFVNLLEQTIIDTLAEYGVIAKSREDAPGVYVDNSKICSIGLRIHRGCSYHGLALNVTTDLSYFKRINPCGYKNLQMCNVSEFNKNATFENLQTSFINNFRKNFEYDDSIKPLRKPEWIRSKLLSIDSMVQTKKLLHNSHLTTVCDEAACPNRSECFSRGTATFMIMGDICTRNCHFCNVTCGKPKPLDIKEPDILAQTIAAMQLKYVVITSVCRDDLSDGGAMHFVQCIKSIRLANSSIKIEILAPDFRNHESKALKILDLAPPDVFGHNIETVPRLYKEITPSSNYKNSLKLLFEHKKLFPHIPTKSGIMVGLGETDEEIIEVLKDLRTNSVDYLTIGQYLQPNKTKTLVSRYVTPMKFDEFKKFAKQIGFIKIASGPMVRSSYYADQM